MIVPTTTPSARRSELLEAAYRYALEHGIADLSLRPLATSIGSSTGVLRFLFGNKERLVQALLARAREDGQTILNRVAHSSDSEAIGLASAIEQIWDQLVADENRQWLRLSNQASAQAIVGPGGACSDFALATVNDWLTGLAACQPLEERESAEGASRRTLALALLRGALLDFLATGDRLRVSAAVEYCLALLRSSDTTAPRS